MAARLTVRPTNLKYGHVYELHNRLPYDTPREMVVEAGIGDLIADESDWIFSPAPPTRGRRKTSHVEVVGRKRREVERFKCSLNPAHGRLEGAFDFEIDLSYVTQPIPPFVNDAEAAHVLVNEWLADRLMTSGLKGFRLLPTTVSEMPEWYENENATPLAKVFQITFDGRFPKQVPHIEPSAADKCPHCGAAPIICQECGHFSNPCSKCDEMWGAAESSHKGPRDPRILIEKLGTVANVIDPRRWDGTDFMGWSTGGWITKRALDWLLSIHAGPFLAQPIAVNVAGLTPAEKERLEDFRRPLPGVKPQLT